MTTTIDSAEEQVDARLTASLPADLRDQFTEVARSHDRSVSAELRVAMRAHIAAAGREPRLTYPKETR